MKIKKICIVPTLFTCLCVNANDEISYNWLELNHHWSDRNTFSLGGSFELSENFYLRADTNSITNEFRLYTSFDSFTNLEYRQTTYGLALGFHTPISQNTDFYTELGYRRAGVSFLDDAGGAEFVFGTRTALSPKFELLTSIDYQAFDIDPYDDFDDDTRFKVGVSALYDLSDKSKLHFGIDTDKNKKVVPFIGYRFSW